MIEAIERQTAALIAALSQLHLDTPSRDLDAVSAVNSVNLHDLQVKRVSAKLQKALDWLRDNPGHLDTPSRDLDTVIGVSHMTVYKAQQIMKGIED